MRPALFLDRDGTINHDPGYIRDPEIVRLIDGVAENLKDLKRKFDFKLIIISNQAGVAKGLMTIEDVEAVNKRVKDLLEENGVAIDDIYYCPYHPDFDPPEKSKCRKPSPFMILQAAKDHDIDLSKSFMIGDRASDIEAGINANIKTILISQQKENGEIENLINDGKKPNFVAADFYEINKYITQTFAEENN
ncbi:Histidinol phosphatase-like protein [Melioribacter roseus P3M-2]|uniref:D,D-heptose 1,7-bisphosphate phosphatase n=1 Tax=Melioribacter roseus (strain DSM 23840 / JCM 17771 / VKM B-2668 / P3M-2) TaxID=1191523 RepID=I6ZZY8_MELRP|nr:HAD family hydrolase [Melioribacter roseus]AFN73296.1 Histidinol phosphatase-like protein [Melioribacter roseus P3M-2]